MITSTPDGIEYDTKDIKSECVACGAKIPPTPRNYEVRGNYCVWCCVAVKKNKNGKV